MAAAVAAVAIVAPVQEQLVQVQPVPVLQVLRVLELAPDAARAPVRRVAEVRLPDRPQLVAVKGRDEAAAVVAGAVPAC